MPVHRSETTLILGTPARGTTPGERAAPVGSLDVLHGAAPLTFDVAFEVRP
jgi:hypothetical protein